MDALCFATLVVKANHILVVVVILRFDKPTIQIVTVVDCRNLCIFIERGRMVLIYYPLACFIQELL